MFEHTTFLTEPYIEYLLNKNNFEIIKKNYFKKDHSIFYAAKRKEKLNYKSLSKNLYDENIKIYNEYVNHLKNYLNQINFLIKNLKDKVYLFGGHIFSQTLINYGLDTKKIEFILDNDENKHNKRLYGTSLIVKSPKILRFDDSPYVILRAGSYSDEIKKDILKNINSKTNFI